MYDMYVKKCDKEYITIEDNQSLSIINSNSDIEEILELENEIEKLSNIINDYKIEIHDLECKITSKEGLNSLFYVIELIIGLGFVFTFNLWIAIILTITFVISHNIFLNKNFESKLLIERKIKNINREIDTNEKLKDEYTKKLKNKKVLSNYKQIKIDNNLEKIGIINDITMNYHNKIKRLIKTRGGNTNE